MTTQANNVAIESSQINSSGVLLTTGGGTGLSTVGTNGQVLTSNGTTLSWVTPSASTLTGTLGVANGGTGLTSLTAGYIPYGNGTSAFGSSSNLFWDSTNSRLGIGTTTPYAPLQVTGTIKVATGNAQGILGLGEASGTTVNVGVWRGSANAPTTDGNYLNLGGYDGIVFATGNAAIGSQSERMRIDSSGNVGIGTSSPNSRLSVDGGSLASGGNSLNIASSLTTGRTGTYDSATVSSIHTYYDNKTVEISTGISSGYVSGISMTGSNASLFTGTVRFLTGSTERMRIDSSGNVLINTTLTTLGNFTNYNKVAVISADPASGSPYGQYAITNYTAAVNNSTVTVLRFLRADGTLTGGSGLAGIVTIRVTGGSGANQYLASFTLNSAGNGTGDALFSLINAAKVRGTSPVSSVQIANDGGGGAIQVTITYINNTGVVNSGVALVSFIGVCI